MGTDTLPKGVVLEEEYTGEDGERHPEMDVLYAERFCGCGAILKIRGRRHQLLELKDASSSNILGDWDARHHAKKGKHRPVTEKKAREIHDLLGGE